MEAFKIQIAGLVVLVKPMFVSTREYCRAYLTDGEPEVTVEVTPEDLVDTQAMTEKEALEEGIRIRKYEGPYLERLTIQHKVARELLKRNTILFHGSTVAVDGYAYLFTAPCRTGKSTHTRFWCEIFGSRAMMVNDDKPFLQITPSGVLAYGSPWSGKHGLDSNVCVPLKGICFLRRGSENRIARVQVEDFLAELYHQCWSPEDPEVQKIAESLVDSLAQQVPLWQMDCTKDPAAALVSHGAMSSL